ncbi:MAG TPA: TMEM165/GDT1 family protein [Chroococcidiopsis sp.]
MASADRPESLAGSASSPAEAVKTKRTGFAPWGKFFSYEVGIFLSTFVTIFLAEIGDKTQMTTLLMSASSQSPWVVFAGAGTALVATSLIGVLLGRWLPTRVSSRNLETAAAVMMLVISVMLLWDVAHL